MKKRIAIASILKPVDDVRSFWKIAQSIAKTNKYEVNIIANESKNRSDLLNINLQAHSLNRASWITRYFTRYRVVISILRIKPQLLIITDHELLRVSVLAKWLTGCRLVYDVQENYYRNLTHLNSSIIKKVYAYLVRLNERISTTYIDQYWLAERCYLDEMQFIHSNKLVVENKAFEISIDRSKSEEELLLFTGTISEYGGIKLAIDVYHKLLEFHPKMRFKIVGQVHDLTLKNELKNLAEKSDNLLLRISTEPIPHPEILSSIQEASLGIISYQPNEVNHRKTPTKLYEYSRYKLPYLIQENTHWQTKSEILGGAIPVNLTSNFKKEEILEIARKVKESNTKEYPFEETWEFESQKIISSINSLLDD